MNDFGHGRESLVFVTWRDLRSYGVTWRDFRRLNLLSSRFQYVCRRGSTCLGHRLLYLPSHISLGDGVSNALLCLLALSSVHRSRPRSLPRLLPLPLVLPLVPPLVLPQLQSPLPQRHLRDERHDVVATSSFWEVTCYVRGVLLSNVFSVLS